MPNNSFNTVMYYGNITSLNRELDLMLAEHRRLPTTYTQIPEYCDHMFDLEVFIDPDDKNMLCLIYTSHGSISMNLLIHFAESYGLEFKGTFTGEDETPETCGYVVGTRDKSGTLHSSCITMEDCGVTNLPEDPDEHHTFICDTVDSLSDMIFELNKTKGCNHL